jgi:hypothetical protein
LKRNIVSRLKKLDKHKAKGLERRREIGKDTEDSSCTLYRRAKMKRRKSLEKLDTKDLLHNEKHGNIA